MVSSSASSTFGPILISLYISIYLTSSCVHLNHSYFSTTLDDWKWKSSVSIVTVASTAHTGISCWAVYEDLIEGFGEMESLAKGGWAFTAHIGFLVSIGFIVQLYYAFKLSTLYSSRLRIGLVSSIAFFAAAQLACGIVAIYTSVHSPVPLFSMNVHQDLGWQTLSYLICTVVCNLIISIASLVDARSPRFAVRSETILEIASRLIVETNLLATICSILYLSFLLAWNNEGRQSGVWMAFAMILPKLYVFSLLASHTRGAEITQAHLTTDYGKHASSLSDMFKGSPISPISRSQNPITFDRIGTPQVQVQTNTPIADRYAHQPQGIVSPESPGWLRRTIQPSPLPSPSTNLAPPLPSFTRQSSATALSISDYGEFLAPSSGEGHEEDLHYSSSEDEKNNNKEEGFSTSIEVTLSPRRTTFNESPVREEGKVVRLDGIGMGGMGRSGVSYGYL